MGSGGEKRRADGRHVHWAIPFALLTAMGWCWALSSPLQSGPDEYVHAIRAASVVRGEILIEEVPGFYFDTTRVRVPSGFVDNRGLPQCYTGRPEVTPICSPDVADGTATRTATIYVGFGPPLFYALVGGPSHLSAGATGLYLMRMLSVTIAVAFVTLALRSAERLGGLAPVGAAAALTPASIYLASTINPNGLEIAAALALWSSALVVTRLGPVECGRACLVTVAVSFAVLVNIRGLSLLFGLVTIAVALVVGRTPMSVLRGDARVRRVLAVCSLSVVVAAAWMLTEGGRQDMVLRGEAVTTSTGEIPTFTRDLVARIGDVRPHPAVWLTWVAMVGTLVVVGLVRARGRERAGLVVLLALVIALPVVIQALVIAPIGTNWQGRYILPLAVGIPLVAGVLAGRPRRELAAAIVGLLTLLQVAAFALPARRYGVGLGGPLLYSLDPEWEPPITSLALLATFAVAAVGLAVYLVAVSAPRATLPGDAGSSGLPLSS